MTLILFVCRGNTCRSPLAEALARELGRRDDVTRPIGFTSAGIAPATLFSPADPRAVVCASHHGLDLTGHSTRQVSAELLHSATRIFALDRDVQQHLHAMKSAPPIELLMDLAPEAGVKDVADPWHGTAADYEAAFALIGMAVRRLMVQLAAGNNAS